MNSPVLIFLLALDGAALSCRSRSTREERLGVDAQSAPAETEVGRASHERGTTSHVGGYEIPYEVRLRQMHEPVTPGGDGYRFVLLGPSIAGRESATLIRRIAEHIAVRKDVKGRVTLEPRVQVTEDGRPIAKDEWFRLDECMRVAQFWDSALAAVDPAGGGPVVIEGWRPGRYGVIVPPPEAQQLELCRKMAEDVAFGGTISADGCRTLPLNVRQWDPSDRTWTRLLKTLCRRERASVYSNCGGVRAVTFLGRHGSGTRYYDGRTGKLLGAEGQVGDERLCWGTVPQVRLDECTAVDRCQAVRIRNKRTVEKPLRSGNARPAC